jgi:AraC-like DNA-binding protein
MSLHAPQNPRTGILPDHQEAHPELADSGLARVGVAGVEAGFTQVQRNLAYGLVLVTMAGEGEVLVDGRYRALDTEQAYCCPAGSMPAYRNPSDNCWNFAWATLLPSVGRAAGGQPTIRELPEPDLASTIRCLDLELNGSGNPLVINHLSELLRRRVTDLLHDPSAHLDPAAVWRLMAHDLAHPWSLDELAQRAGIGREQLRRLCLREHGCSPMAHLFALRMRKVSDLAAKGLPWKQIATRTGYPRWSSFRTAYHRHFGTYPPNPGR